MKIRAAVSLVSAVATLALVLSLIACGETKGDGETASAVHPEVPNIPIATSSVTEPPVPSTNKPDSTQTTRDPATAPPTSAETATATEPVDVLTEPQRMLIAAAVRTANTDGAHVTVVCVNRLTDGAGQSHRSQKQRGMAPGRRKLHAVRNRWLYAAGQHVLPDRRWREGARADRAAGRMDI